MKFFQATIEYGTHKAFTHEVEARDINSAMNKMIKYTTRLRKDKMYRYAQLDKFSLREMVPVSRAAHNDIVERLNEKIFRLERKIAVIREAMEN